MTETMEVEPINTKRYDGKTIKDKYTYDRVHVEDIPRDFYQSSVDFQKGADKIRWEYKGKCPILIHPTKIEAEKGVSVEEAQNQAYFALSILSDEGYVSRFQKK